MTELLSSERSTGKQDEPNALATRHHRLPPLAVEDQYLGLGTRRHSPDGFIEIHKVAKASGRNDVIIVTDMLSQGRNLLSYRIRKQIGHAVGTIYVVMGVVLSAVGNARLLAWLEPHV